MLVRDECDDDPQVRNVLALCIYDPSPDNLDALCRRYTSEAEWELLTWRHDETIIGCLGIERTGDNTATLRHIGVMPAFQRSGIGRQMLAELIRIYRFSRLEAETDRDAVGFYRRCGFSVESLGEQFPGVERFRCVLRTPPLSGTPTGD